MNQNQEHPLKQEKFIQPSPTPTTHPLVHEKIRECDRLYLEEHGVENKHLKVCWKLMCMGHPVSPEKLDDLCQRYCRRWTYPF